MKHSHKLWRCKCPGSFPFLFKNKDLVINQCIYIYRHIVKLYLDIKNSEASLQQSQCMFRHCRNCQHCWKSLLLYNCICYILYSVLPENITTNHMLLLSAHRMEVLKCVFICYSVIHGTFGSSHYKFASES